MDQEKIFEDDLFVSKTLLFYLTNNFKIHTYVITLKALILISTPLLDRHQTHHILICSHQVSKLSSVDLLENISSCIGHLNDKFQQN